VLKEINDSSLNLSGSVFRFFSARQVPEILNESSMNIPETLKMPSLSDLGKRPQGVLKNQSTRSLLVGLKYVKLEMSGSFQVCS
jgi:hypothetical protein